MHEGELNRFCSSLSDAVEGGLGLGLDWEEARAVAKDARSERMTLEPLRDNGTRMNAWAVLGALAGVAGVRSDRPEVRTRAAASALASGLVGDPVAGSAAVLLLLLSTPAPEFEGIPFGVLRHDERPVGTLITWIANLYVQLRLCLYGCRSTPGHVEERVESWPFDSYGALPVAVALATPCDDQTALDWIGSDQVEGVRGLDAPSLAAWCSDVGLDTHSLFAAIETEPPG